LIPDAKISEIRERIDIAQVIGEYVSLHKAGANVKGVCPFHADSDPSFNVNPARQFFHCFGCGASGDVFGFLMRIEGIDFNEAAIRLAGRAGVTLPERPKTKEAQSREERIQEEQKRRYYILDESARFFEESLFAEGGAAARDALLTRGIKEETRAKFRLGYAPDAWSALIDGLAKQHVSPNELESVGLALQRKSGTGYYDRFRHRLMFTITDPTGRPIGFSGRALSQEEADKGAKYINSPETDEYKKGRVLYGLHQARVAMSKSREVVLVEGNFDVVSMHQAGIENVAAPLGTALTEDQALLLRRRVEKVVVMFDGDGAGRKAAARAFPTLAGASLASYAVPLPQGEDPDSLARKSGPEEIRKRLAGKVGLLDYIIQNAALASDGSIQDKARQVEKLKPFVDALSSPLELDLYRKKIADIFGIDPNAVYRVLGGRVPGRSVPFSEPAQSKGSTSEKNPGRVAERELVGLVLDCPELIPRMIAENVMSYISDQAFKGVLEHMAHLHEKGELCAAAVLSFTDEGPMRDWLAERAMMCFYEKREKADFAFNEIVGQLAKKPISEKIKELDYKIRMASAAGDDMGVLELSRKKADLLRTSLNSVSKFDLGRSSV
jgi:DNA primase